jgi:hypothetical protein
VTTRNITIRAKGSPDDDWSLIDDEDQADGRMINQLCESIVRGHPPPLHNHARSRSVHEISWD